MTAKSRYLLPFLVAGLPLATLSSQVQAESVKDNSAYTWPSHYDFFLPYGSKDGGPLFAKPGYKGVDLILNCREAMGLLKLKGYRDIEVQSCSGSIYRFGVSPGEGRLVIELDPRTGDTLRRHQL
jgi:hypothetical protein